MDKMPVRLNFFPLNNQELLLPIYRVPFCGQTKQPGYYKAKLPESDRSERYTDFWTTTTKVDGFERYLYSGEQNPNLALNVIWEQFVKRVQQVLRSDEFSIGDSNAFVRRVDIIIARYTEGNQVVEIQPYYLRVTRQLGFLVDFAFRKSGNVPFSSRIQQLSLSITSAGKSNANYYSDKLDKITSFMRNFGTRLFQFTVGGEEYGIEPDMQLLDSAYLRVKSYVFAGDKEDSSQVRGIRTHGPLQPLSKSPQVVCIFHKKHRDLANTFYSALVGKRFPDRFSGMEKMFGVRLNADQFTAIHIESHLQPDLQVLETRILQYQELYKDRDIIGVFIMDEEDQQLGGFSAYHYVKYLLTQHHIPMQAVKASKIAESNTFQWSIGNIALQIFAKLGGIPWKVKPSNQRCIIFGVGSAHKRDVFGKITKHFAYSVCIDSSGIYRKINVLGNATSREEYIHQLGKNIQQVVSDNLDPDTQKCVMHLPFKLKRDEMDYIESGVRELAQLHQDVQFQFIKINTKNRFFGYAANNTKVPYESSYIELSQDEFLVWFEGLQYHKPYLNRKVGNPVHVQFLNSSGLDATEKRRYLQDIINLSGANWRGFNAKLAPISVFYPEIIADFLAEFRQIDPGHDVDINDFYLPWFL